MAGDLQNRIRELLTDLRECREPVSRSTEIEDALVLAMIGIPLDRPSSMTKCQDAYAEWLIEEAEQFAALVSMVTLEMRDGFSSQQRSSFRKIILNLRHDLERFGSDLLLVIGDRQEIRRRIEAS